MSKLYGALAQDRFLAITLLTLGLLLAIGLTGAALVHSLVLPVLMGLFLILLGLLAVLRLLTLSIDERIGWLHRRGGAVSAWLGKLLQLLGDLPDFTYAKEDKHNPTAAPQRVFYRSFIQWLIMGIGEVIALATAFLVITVFCSIAIPPDISVSQHFRDHHSPTRPTARSRSVCELHRHHLHDLYSCPRCRDSLQWFHKLSFGLTFLQFSAEGPAVERQTLPSISPGAAEGHTNAPVGTHQTNEQSPSGPPPNEHPKPYDRPWTQLGLAMLQLANIGILVLSANAVLEIGLLIEEPGVEHVRRVLALSFTGMALYLIKEFPINQDKTEFQLGCLSGAIAALLWLMHPLQKFLMHPLDKDRMQALQADAARQASMRATSTTPEQLD